MTVNITDRSAATDEEFAAELARLEGAPVAEEAWDAREAVRVALDLADGLISHGPQEVQADLWGRELRRRLTAVAAPAATDEGGQR